MLRTTLLCEVLKERIENLNSDWIQETKKRNGYKTYLNEHATFKIALGRGSGHTSLAKAMLKEYEDLIVIVPSVCMTDFFEPKDKFTGRVRHIKSLALRGQGHLWENKIVIVDVSPVCSKSDIEELKRNMPKCLIILG